MYTESQLKSFKLAELRAKAKEEKIKGIYKLNKEQLVAKLAFYYQGADSRQHDTNLVIPGTRSTTPGVSLAHEAQTSASQQACSNDVIGFSIAPSAGEQVEATIYPITPPPFYAGQLFAESTAFASSGPLNHLFNFSASPKPSQSFSAVPSIFAKERGVGAQHEQILQGTQPPTPPLPPPWIPGSAMDPARGGLPLPLNYVHTPLTASKISKLTSVPSKTTTTKPFVPLRQVPKLAPSPHATSNASPSQEIQQTEPSQQFLSMLLQPRLPTETLLQYHVNCISNSWIESLFQLLNAKRVTPILQPPYPASVSLPQKSLSSELAFQGLHPRIYELLTPGFETALRFWTSRLHTALSLGAATEAGTSRMDLYGPDISMWPVVVKCEKITDAIWLIETQCTMVGKERQKRANPGSTSTSPHPFGTGWMSPSDGGKSLEWIEDDKFLVLSLTGEVISYPMRDYHDKVNVGDIDSIRGCPLRRDVFRYISLQSELPLVAATHPSGNLLMGNSIPLPICQGPIRLPRSSSILRYVRTKDPYDFPFGISRHWLGLLLQERRTDSVATFEVAKRAVLSSCMLNGISGSHLSLIDQEASQTGTAYDSANVSGSEDRLVLFLPEASQVLSVHLLGAPYHPAIAFIARGSGNTDIVLRSTGQSIGNQDYEGVSPLWCGLLGCDSFGKVVSEATRAEYWDAWEARIDAKQD